MNVLLVTVALSVVVSSASRSIVSSELPLSALRTVLLSTRRFTVLEASRARSSMPSRPLWATGVVAPMVLFVIRTSPGPEVLSASPRMST